MFVENFVEVQVTHFLFLKIATNSVLNCNYNMRVCVHMNPDRKLLQ